MPYQTSCIKLHYKTVQICRSARARTGFLEHLSKTARLRRRGRGGLSGAALLVEPEHHGGLHPSLDSQCARSSPPAPADLYLFLSVESERQCSASARDGVPGQRAETAWGAQSTAVSKLARWCAVKVTANQRPTGVYDEKRDYT